MREYFIIYLSKVAKFITTIQPPDPRIRAIRNTDNSKRRNPPDYTTPTHFSSLYPTQLLVGPLRCLMGGCMERMWVYYAAVPGSRGGGENEGCWDGGEEGGEEVAGGKCCGAMMMLGGVSSLMMDVRSI